MQAKSINYFFPKSCATLVHQDGSNLTEPTSGVEIILHTRQNESHPCCAELTSGEHYAEVGLFFEGNKLVDYDGAFSLPQEVGVMLTEIGYTVPREFFE